MKDVYVLSGREYLGNSEWGHGCDDTYIIGVYDNFEKAKEAFKNSVIETARKLADNEDDFEYTEENLFECCENEITYGWNCSMDEDYCEWVLIIPETAAFDYGFWFNPVVILQKCEIK